jgi:hypothetical protein
MSHSDPPTGRYGSEFGLSNDLCSGPCSPGYYCQAGSLTSTPLPCGSNSVYCPEGSFQPTLVTPGYYTTGGGEGNSSSLTRSSQTLCEKGFYCTEGGEKLSCLPGAFGDTQGLYMSCSGTCAVILSTMSHLLTLPLEDIASRDSTVQPTRLVPVLFPALLELMERPLV